MQPDVRSLISAYLAEIAAAIEDLRDAFPDLDNIHDWKRLAIPREGVLPSGRKFFFHGIGCRFELDADDVDVDFGPNGETNGFDAWRILCFQKNRETAMEMTRAEIEHALSEMYESGDLVRIKNSSLFFLRA
jgi:hypothetical protein